MSYFCSDIPKNEYVMQKPEELFQRYIWLVNTLLSAKSGISFPELSRKWQDAAIGDGEFLPRSTFNRHRESIQNLFGIDIKCDKSRGNLYYIDNPDSLKGNSIQNWMLRTLTVGNVLKNGRELYDRILLEEMPMGQEHLQTIFDAMAHGHVLHLDYSKMYSSTKTIELEPYSLKVFRQRWYLLAHNTLYPEGDLRVYSLDRMSCMRETEQEFVLPEDFDAASYFGNDFGVYTGGEAKVQDIVIHAFGRLPDYLRSLPLHPSQRETIVAPDFVEFRYHLRPTYDFRQELLSQADELEVIAPQSFREEFAAVLKRANERNAGTTSFVSLDCKNSLKD